MLRYIEFVVSRLFGTGVDTFVYRVAGNIVRVRGVEQFPLLVLLDMEEPHREPLRSRFLPPFRCVQHLVGVGLFGENAFPAAVRAHFRLDGGVVQPCGVAYFGTFQLFPCRDGCVR